MIYLTANPLDNSVTIQDGVGGRERKFKDFFTSNRALDRQLPFDILLSIITNILNKGEVEFTIPNAELNYLCNSGACGELILEEWDAYGQQIVILYTDQISDEDFESYSIELLEIT
jgi:hypothetical protein